MIPIHSSKNTHIITKEEDNLLDIDFALCVATLYEKADLCLRHTAHKMLAGNTQKNYTLVSRDKGHAALLTLRTRLQ